MRMLEKLRRLVSRRDPPPTLDPGVRIARALAGVAAGRPGAADAVRREMEAARGRGWIAIDAMLRRSLDPIYSAYGNAPPPAAEWVRGVAVPTNAACAVFAALASHPDGYVREAAVERLAAIPGAVPIAPLLLRGTDWVAQVRSRAADALRDRMRPEQAKDWVEALVLVTRLGASGRSDARSLMSEVEAYLASEGARGAVLEGIEANDREVRRACFRSLLRGAEGGAGLIRRGLESSDGAIRAHAGRAAERLPGSAAAGVVHLLLRDPLPPVRAAGVRLAAREPGARAILSHALFDRAAGVRREARAALAGEEPSPLAIYRNALRDGAAPAEPTLLGLSETGDSGDAWRAEPFLSHPRASVRRAALIALDRLAGAAATPALVGGLGDESPAVCRAAARRLAPRIRGVDPRALEACLGAGRPRHVRVAALALLAARDKWEGLPAILDAISDTDGALRERGRELLAHWRTRFNRSAVDPSPAQRTAVLAALAGVEGSLDPETVRWLRFILR